MLFSTTRPLVSWSWRERVLLRLLNGFVGICYEVLNIQIYQMVIILLIKPLKLISPPATELARLWGELCTP